jgi:hypothetical protein
MIPVIPVISDIPKSPYHVLSPLNGIAERAIVC